MREITKAISISVDGKPLYFCLTKQDASSGELLINRVPLICSYGQVNDLFLPFRHIREGQGLGSLFVIKNTDELFIPDPAKGNLAEFKVLFG